jgi:hypothetical protein
MNGPKWDGRVYKPAKFGDGTVAGTVNDPRTYRRRYAEKARLDAIAAAEIQQAKFARLPWPVRAIGRVTDLFWKVTGL